MSLLYKLKHLFMPNTKEMYVSDIDEYVAKFDNEHPTKSASQVAEINKHARIAKLRDDAKASTNKGKIWEKF